MSVEYRYAYLHGFASSSQARKGQYLAGVFAEQGLKLELPDLNRPSFRKLTYTGALRGLDDLDRRDGRTWRFIGSSMGGYLAARWAAMNPDRVDRMVLLCPAFELVERWPKMVGPRRMERWEREGYLELPGPDGTMQPLHWEFIEDARSHPGTVEFSCPAIIIHGTRDPTVPIEYSRRYVRSNEGVELVEVDDMHGLMDSVELIAQRSLSFFEIGE